MNRQQDFDTTIRIPVITDLVLPGDPEIIQRAKSGESAELQQNFEKRLQERISELQSAAAGQDGYTRLERAHAIRSENQDDKQPAPKEANDYEQQIDQHRGELIRELSTMNK